MTRPYTPSKSSSDELYVVSHVGEGIFGKVYKARNTVSGLYVVLKRIHSRRQRKLRQKQNTDQRRVRALSPCSHMRAHGRLRPVPYHRWIGTIILLIVSFSVNGAVTIMFFLCPFLRRFFMAPQPSDPLAEAPAINLSVHPIFALFDVVGHPSWLVAEQAHVHALR
jgi:hypothetical protein